MRSLLRSSRKSSISCVRCNETSDSKPIAKTFPQNPALVRRRSASSAQLVGGVLAKLLATAMQVKFDGGPVSDNAFTWSYHPDGNAIDRENRRDLISK